MRRLITCPKCQQFRESYCLGLCQLCYGRQYYADHKAEIAQYQKEWYAKNKTRIQAHRREQKRLKRARANG